VVVTDFKVLVLTKALHFLISRISSSLLSFLNEAVSDSCHML
jgi:hypothetical protein